MKKATPNKLLAAALAAAPGVLLAHPASHHAMTGQQAREHLLSDAWHVALITLAVVAACLAATRILRRRSDRT